MGATLQASSSRTAAVSGRKLGQLAGVETSLALGTGGQQLFSTSVEGPMQLGHEGERVRGQHRVGVWQRRRA